MDSAWKKISEIEFDDQELSAYQLNHADDIVAGLTLELPLLHLRLVADDGRSSILDVEFRDLCVTLCKRNKFLAVQMSLHSFQAHDRWSTNSYFPFLARNSPRLNPAYFPSTGGRSTYMTLPGGRSSSTGKQLFSLSVQLPPLDHSSSLKVVLDAGPIEITICMPFLLRVAEFFAIQPVNLHAVEELMIDQLAKARQQSSAALTDALESHSTLDLNLTWQAPKVTRLDAG